MRRKAQAALALPLLLAGCTVGPDFRPEAPMLPAAFVEAAAAGTGEAPGTTWDAVAPPELLELQREALAHDATLAAADARLAASRAIAGLTRFSLIPTVTADGDAEQSRISAEDPFAPGGTGVLASRRAGFDARWEIDLFGSLRRQSQAIHAEAAAAAADRAAVRISVLAETALAYAGCRSAVAEHATQARAIANLTADLQLREQALALGRGSGASVAAARAQGLLVAASLPELEAAVGRARQRLAVLTGVPADDPRLACTGDDPPWPESVLAVGTPQDWIRRRPDVAAAEARLEAATARIGVATAEYFPKLELTGAFGSTARRTGDLFGIGSERWRYGPSLSWRFLDFGRVQREVLAADARADEALAEYRQSVRLALEEAENALAGWRASRAGEALLVEAEAAAAEALRLARARERAGRGDVLASLEAERAHLEAARRLAIARGQRLSALAALYKALAGDFLDREPAVEP